VHVSPLCFEIHFYTDRLGFGTLRRWRLKSTQSTHDNLGARLSDRRYSTGRLHGLCIGALVTYSVMIDAKREVWFRFLLMALR
jgi:hypothetical protein